MPHTPVFFALTAAMCLLAGSAARANRPLNTDTADPVPAGRCQLEPFAGSTRSDGAPTERFWLVQVNCGLSERLQLGASLTRSESGAASEHALAVSGKTALVMLEPGHTGLALGYGLSALQPHGGSWSGEGALLYGIASREVRDGWLLHANLGWAHSRTAAQNSTTYGVATEYSATPSTVLSAELYGDDRSRPWLAAGLFWQAAERFSVNASYGVQNKSPRARQFTAGCLFEF